MITIDRIIYKKCFHEIVKKILQAHADRKGDFIGEVLFVSKIIINEGDNGIKTYEGLFNNEIHVAVKCIPQDAQCLRSKENWMRITKHPNLINCFIVMEHQKCWYVALERCYCNLQQLIEKVKTKNLSLWAEEWEGRPTSGLMRIIRSVWESYFGTDFFYFDIAWTNCSDLLFFIPIISLIYWLHYCGPIKDPTLD